MDEEVFKWLSPKEVVELQEFTKIALKKSRFSGRSSFHDISLNVMLNNEGKTLKVHKKLINPEINKQFKIWYLSKFGEEYLEEIAYSAVRWLRNKLMDNPEYKKKHLARNNQWEKDDRERHSRHSKRRNTKARKKAQGKATEKKAIEKEIKKNLGKTG
jgi:hypothetical protein